MTAVSLLALFLAGGYVGHGLANRDWFQVAWFALAGTIILVVLAIR